MRRFESPSDFAAFLRHAAGESRHGQSAGLRDAAALFAEKAKGYLGAYQPALGPIPEWPELAESTKDERADLGFPDNEPLLRTGELRDAIASAHDGRRAAVGVDSRMVGDGTRQNPYRDIGAVAADMEMGTDRAPPRPFLSRAVYEHKETAALTILGATMAPLVGKGAARDEVRRIGHRKAPDEDRGEADDIPF